MGSRNHRGRRRRIPLILGIVAFVVASTLNLTSAGAATNSYGSFTISLSDIFNAFFGDDVSAPANGEFQTAGLHTISTYIPPVAGSINARHAVTDLNSRILAYNSLKNSTRITNERDFERVQGAEQDAAEVISDVQYEVYRLNSYRYGAPSERLRDALTDLVGTTAAARGAVGNATNAVERARAN